MKLSQQKLVTGFFFFVAKNRHLAAYKYATPFLKEVGFLWKNQNAMIYKSL